MVETLKFVAVLLVVVSFALGFLAGFTKLGKKRLVQFLTGEFAFLAAIAYGFLTALGVGQYSSILLVFLFVFGSVKFAYAVFMKLE